MILDTSALFAILGDEPERRSFNEAIEAAENRRMPVATYVETSIVLEARHGAEGSRELDLFLERAAIELVPVDIEQAKLQPAEKSLAEMTAPPTIQREAPQTVRSPAL